MIMISQQEPSLMFSGIFSTSCRKGLYTNHKNELQILTREFTSSFSDRFIEKDVSICKLPAILSMCMRIIVWSTRVRHQI